MPTAAKLVRTYIRAKDENRPHLIGQAFAADAVLEMTVRTDVVSFPPRTEGAAAIADLLVRRFNRTYENIYTFCLTEPPAEAVAAFSCDWLVGMSEKDGGDVLVGCGRYDWRFGAGSTGLVTGLTITLEHMVQLSTDTLAPVMAWLTALPYPWCGPNKVIKGRPDIEGLQAIVAWSGSSET